MLFFNLKEVIVLVLARHRLSFFLDVLLSGYLCLDISFGWGSLHFFVFVDDVVFFLPSIVIYKVLSPKFITFILFNLIIGLFNISLLRIIRKEANSTKF